MSDKPAYAKATADKPKWATPDRQSALVRLFTISRGFCVFGHKDCLIPEHHYELYAEVLIKDWIKDDKADKAADWQFEREALHRTNDRRYPLEGQFSAVGKDIFFSEQPESYTLALGMSGLTFKPFVKVRLASSFIALHIDLGDSLKGIGKNQRRKAIRYGRITERYELESGKRSGTILII